MRPELVGGHPADFDELSPHNTRRTSTSAVLSSSMDSARMAPPRALTTRLDS
jgi:hypothetical protein